MDRIFLKENKSTYIHSVRTAKKNLKTLNLFWETFGDIF